MHVSAQAFYSRNSYGLQHNGRCLIGDEMGLGKTLQAIAIACVFRQKWPLLIVCPSSVRYVWAEEIMNWVGLDADTINVVLNGKTAVTGLVTIISYDLATKLSKYVNFSVLNLFLQRVESSNLSNDYL